jgi:hypothetical protein
MAYWSYDYIFLLAGFGVHWFLNKLFYVWLDGARHTHLGMLSSIKIFKKV